MFTLFAHIIRDQGCVKAEKAFYIMYWFMTHLPHLRCGDHSCFLKYRSSVKSPRTYYEMEKKWLFFLNDILHRLVALYGREGFKATGFDIHSPHSFYLYDKVEVVPLQIDFPFTCTRLAFSNSFYRCFVSNQFPMPLTVSITERKSYHG